MACCNLFKMILEDKLTDAENRVLAAFRADDTSVDVAGAEIRGNFLRGLFLGGYDGKADYCGTRIVGAFVSDVLNMEFCETKFPMQFRDCSFYQEVKLQQLTCPKLNFRGCTLEKGIVLNDAKVAGTVFLNDGFKAVGEVSLLRASIGGQLDCTGGIFQNGGMNALSAQNIKVVDNVFLHGEFNGMVNLVNAEIGGQLNCKEGSFQNEDGIALNAQGIKMADNVFLDDRFEAVGAVWLAGADIRGQLACAGGIFQNECGDALNAQDIKVTGIVFLCNGFKAKGAVSLLGAEVGGQLNCEGGSFQNEGGDALNAQNIKVADTVFLCNGFNAEGAVSLSGAEIGGQLNCGSGSFQNEGGDALNAQNIKVADTAFLHNGFNAEGAVNLLGAEIGGQLNCGGGSFQNEGEITLNAHNIKVAGDVLLIPQMHEEKEERRNFSADGLMLFSNATIGGNLELNDCDLTHLSLSGANLSGEFRDDAGVYKNDKDGDIDLDIDGFRYQRLNVVKERIKDRLEWVGLMSKGDEFRPHPYEQLVKVYREMGHMNWARKVGFALEKKRHKQLRLNRDHKHFILFGWGWWAWYWVLRGTIGYGYKPFRSMYWFVALILGGFMLFSGVIPCQNSCRMESESCYCMAPSDAEILLSEGWKVNGKLPKDYPSFSPFYYAVEAALPVLPLGQTENWHPKTSWVRWAQGAITIIGALVLTILASYGVGVLGPRWKDE